MTLVASALIITAFATEPQLERLSGELQFAVFLADCGIVIGVGVVLGRWLHSPVVDGVFLAIVVVPLVVLLMFVILANGACEGWLSGLSCPEARD